MHKNSAKSLIVAQLDVHVNFWSPSILIIPLRRCRLRCRTDHAMSMDATPSRNIVQGSWVIADYQELMAGNSPR